MSGRIVNPDKIKVKEESRNEEIVSGNPLYERTLPSSEKILKVVFACLLFLLVFGCGFVARISLHILIWHINPPNEKDNSTLGTLGGLLKHNCTECSKGIANITATCAGRDFTGVDESWIWALYLVIIAPYVWTFLSNLFRICFKTNKKMQLHILLVVVTFEIVHSIGLSIMAFIVLPSFDPASASVVYLSVASLPPLLNFIDKLIKQRKRGKYPQYPHILSYVYAFLGFSLQVAGIILIGIYTKQAALTVLYVTATILVSVKHWENFISMGSEKSAFLRRIKREFQSGRTKVTCVANLTKIIVTFLAVITIFTSRTNKTTEVFMSLFTNETSMFYAIFGERTIGDNPICQLKIPFIVAVINIVCDYLCYKAAKTVCVIYCQRFGFSLPIILLPMATTFTLVGILFKPHVLKFNSCDLLFSEWCLKGIDKLGENCKEVVIAFVLLYISIFLITRNVWKVNGFRYGETSRIMVSPFYCGMFLDLSLLLNRRQNDSEYDVILGKATLDELLHQSLISNEADVFKQSPKLYACCATMWHETANEMTQLLKSIFRLDKRQRINKLVAENTNADDTCGTDSYDEETFDLEAHVFFDDAFEPLKDNEKYPYVNEYVRTFIEVIQEAGSVVHGKAIQIPDGEMYRTPYGARIEWKLPGGNDLIVHLKDKTKIRHKKRWSQVMYMFYILKWKIMGNGKTNTQEIQQVAENTYLLALDGDVDFEPEAVLSLMRRMKKSLAVGAACGRIHPIGSGPMVWYQKFEYAVSHWLQKATEHVIGCVLCSPGCFSLFRGSAILSHNILEKYTTVPQEAIHFLQYDQGEDRWLCTLLLKEGWKIEYCAESDSYTYAPEGFYEFFNQRRRWTPSTMANILDLIVNWKSVTHNNENISLLYIVYQVFLFVSTLLTPGSIFMLIFAAIITGFPAIPPWLSLILNIIPVGVFMLLCLYSSPQLQLQFAAILSSIYAVVMVIVLIGIVKDAIEEGICSMSTIFIIFVAGVFVISAVLHPKEMLCILPGLIYFIAIPSMSMIMFLYSIGNLHVVSWGTRETKQPTDYKKENKTHKPEKEERGYFCSFGSFFSCILCPTNAYTKEDFLYRNMFARVKGIVGNDEVNNDDEKKITTIEMNDEEKTTEEVATKIPKEDQKVKRKKKTRLDVPEFRLCCDENVPIISKEEVKFWKRNIRKSLKPLDKDEQKEKKIEADMLDLRNRVCLFVFLLNTILVTLMYALTQVNAFKDSLSVPFTCAGRDVRIVPISVMFAVVFGLLLLIQFVCMLYHRFSTLIHITAGTDIIDSEDTEASKFDLRIAEYLTTAIGSQPPKSTMISDKKRDVLNRSVISTHEKPYKNLDAIIKKNKSFLGDLEGSLHAKNMAVAKTALQKWLRPVNMQDVVTQIVNKTRMRHQPKTGSNKVEPEDRGRISSISSCEEITQQTSNDAF